MSAQWPEDGGGRARQEDCHLTLEVDSLQILDSALGDGQTVSDEHQRRLQIRGEVRGGSEIGVLGEIKPLGLAIAQKLQA